MTKHRTVATIQLPLDVEPMGTGSWRLTSPVAPGIYISCRTVEEGVAAAQKAIDGMAEAKRSYDMVLDEREACAQIVDEMAKDGFNVPQEIAAAIRART